MRTSTSAAKKEVVQPTTREASVYEGLIDVFQSNGIGQSDAAKMASKFGTWLSKELEAKRHAGDDVDAILGRQTAEPEDVSHTDDDGDFGDLLESILARDEDTAADRN